ncbi:MAG: aminotransferase class V-fold PLP-dependent enzyme [Candidatus Aminicenantes bacterium]|nr:aminotransferase class V-fold PLP-dependent enzyme [Candidatus Aminicenantes bacterium]
MMKKRWDLDKDLTALRQEFPVLKNSVYLISNSLGAVPKSTLMKLMQFYDLWAEEGVSAWKNEWWDLSERVGNKISSLLNADQGSITMIPNATQAHWIALSTKFLSGEKNRDKIVMTDQDFPSSMYSIIKISEFMGWQVEIVRCGNKPFIEAGDIISRVDEKTLFVASSHIYFKSAHVQNIETIAAHARRMGALSLIDGYHASGCYPVDLKKLGVDFYIGGCLKWLCGGPGTGFLYVRPDLASSLEPQLTGWFAHKNPFAFSENMEFSDGHFKFLSGTPPIPCLYTADAGLDFIADVGVQEIRKKSVSQTNTIASKSKERNFRLCTPEQSSLRGGAVSVSMPHAFQVKQALEEKKIKVDFRKGNNHEPDVIRIGPHFYTRDEELNILFNEIDAIYESHTYKKYPEEIGGVT